MIHKTELEAIGTKKEYYEAVIGQYKKDSFSYVITKDSLEELNIAINIWLRDNRYYLKSADKVERVFVTLVAC